MRSLELHLFVTFSIQILVVSCNSLVEDSVKFIILTRLETIIIDILLIILYIFIIQCCSKWQKGEHLEELSSALDKPVNAQGNADEIRYNIHETISACFKLMIQKLFFISTYSNNTYSCNQNTNLYSVCY